jgi:hypothetical protein
VDKTSEHPSAASNLTFSEFQFRAFVVRNTIPPPTVSPQEAFTGSFVKNALSDRPKHNSPVLIVPRESE